MPVCVPVIVAKHIRDWMTRDYSDRCHYVAQALDFLDLAPLLGQIVCKAGDGVNMTDALLKLTAPAANLRPDQLQRLPGLISTLLVVPPSAIQVSLYL
jgi:hypothetical protein